MDKEYQEPSVEVVYFEQNIKALSMASPNSKEDSYNWDDIFGGH